MNICASRYWYMLALPSDIGCIQGHAPFSGTSDGLTGHHCLYEKGALLTWLCCAPWESLLHFANVKNTFYADAGILNFFELKFYKQVNNERNFSFFKFWLVYLERRRKERKKKILLFVCGNGWFWWEWISFQKEYLNSNSNPSGSRGSNSQ